MVQWVGGCGDKDGALTRIPPKQPCPSTRRRCRRQFYLWGTIQPAGALAPALRLSPRKAENIIIIIRVLLIELSCWLFVGYPSSEGATAATRSMTMIIIMIIVGCGKPLEVLLFSRFFPRALLRRTQQQQQEQQQRKGT